MIYVAAIILLLGPLITIHEFGHYIIARLFGVKVLRFSIGFGKPLLSWKSKRSGTVYQIALFPLGGYVKLLDEREMPVKESEKEFEFMSKAPWKRLLIVFAGPAFNILLAIITYWGLFGFMGEVLWKPVIHDVRPDTYASRAGVKPMDQIDSINGVSISNWREAAQEILLTAMAKESMSMNVTALDGTHRSLTIDFSDARVHEDEQSFFAKTGFVKMDYWSRSPTIGVVSEEMPAFKAGVQEGDKVLSINDIPVNSWLLMASIIQKNPEKQLRLMVERDGREIPLLLTPVREQNEDGIEYGLIGVKPVDVDMLSLDQYRTHIDYSIAGALVRSFEEAGSTVSMIGRGLKEIVFGKASLRNISGPGHMTEVAGDTLRMGFLPFLYLLAFVSISLGLVNLLPIPVLDGGHILFYSIEMIKGKPVKEKTFEVGQQIGLGFLILLMSLAIFNDIVRKL